MPTAHLPADGEVHVRVEERQGLLDRDAATSSGDALTADGTKAAPRTSAFGSWRRIWAEARDVRPQLALGLVFLFAASLSFNAMPYLAGQLLDACAQTGAATPAAARARLNAVALQLVLVAALSGGTSGVRAYLFNSASERVVARVRSRLFRALLRQDMAFFDQEKSGSLLSRISADTESLKDAATTNVSILLRSSANVRAKGHAVAYAEALPVANADACARPCLVRSSLRWP
jgi:ABC-type multidrug transport system fused ATPase/permease subunit